MKKETKYTLDAVFYKDNGRIKLEPFERDSCDMINDIQRIGINIKLCPIMIQGVILSEIEPKDIENYILREVTSKLKSLLDELKEIKWVYLMK